MHFLQGKIPSSRLDHNKCQTFFSAIKLNCSCSFLMGKFCTDHRWYNTNIQKQIQADRWGTSVILGRQFIPWRKWWLSTRTLQKEILEASPQPNRNLPAQLHAIQCAGWHTYPWCSGSTTDTALIISVGFDSWHFSEEIGIIWLGGWNFFFFFFISASKCLWHRSAGAGQGLCVLGQEMQVGSILCVTGTVRKWQKLAFFRASKRVACSSAI